MVEKYFDREVEKKMDSKIVEDDEGIEDGKMVIEKVDELKDDFHEHGSDCFKHCSEEKNTLSCYCSELFATFRINSYESSKSKIHPRTNDALS